MFSVPNRHWLTRTLVWGLMVLLLLQSAALACPTCKDSLDQNDPTRANMVQGYFWSILFMMSMPFLILTGLGLLFYWEVRKARAMQRLQEEQSIEEQTTVSAGG